MKLSKKTLITGLVGALIGVVVVLGVRFATYRVESVHYHANFAVYINGQREMFKSPIYYTETACGGEEDMTPYMRAHMHDSVNDVVHVEDEAVTWGQFFDNLGWAIGPDFIQKSDGAMYSERGVNKLNVMINGQDYTGLSSMANMVINDRDKVLISYGSVSQKELKKQYQSIPATAVRYDTAKDPSACSGNHGTSMQDRMKHMF